MLHVYARVCVCVCVCAHAHAHFFSILLTHEGLHREAYRDFQPSLTSSAGPVPRVLQTTGSVHPQLATLPNC